MVVLVGIEVTNRAYTTPSSKVLSGRRSAWARRGLDEDSASANRQVSRRHNNICSWALRLRFKQIGEHALNKNSRFYQTNLQYLCPRRWLRASTAQYSDSDELVVDHLSARRSFALMQHRLEWFTVCLENDSPFRIKSQFSSWSSYCFTDSCRLLVPHLVLRLPVSDWIQPLRQLFYSHYGIAFIRSRSNCIFLVDWIEISQQFKLEMLVPTNCFPTHLLPVSFISTPSSRRTIQP